MQADLSVPFSLGLEGLFYILLLVFAIHAVFVGYHWFTYGSSRAMSTTALAIYLGGGAVLFLTYSFALTML